MPKLSTLTLVARGVRLGSRHLFVWYRYFATNTSKIRKCSLQHVYRHCEPHFLANSTFICCQVVCTTAKTLWIRQPMISPLNILSFDFSTFTVCTSKGENTSKSISFIGCFSSSQGICFIWQRICLDPVAEDLQGWTTQLNLVVYTRKNVEHLAELTPPNIVIHWTWASRRSVTYHRTEHALRFPQWLHDRQIFWMRVRFDY